MQPLFLVLALAFASIPNALPDAAPDALPDAVAWHPLKAPTWTIRVVPDQAVTPDQAKPDCSDGNCRHVPVWAQQGMKSTEERPRYRTGPLGIFRWRTR